MSGRNPAAPRPVQPVSPTGLNAPWQASPPAPEPQSGLAEIDRQKLEVLDGSRRPGTLHRAAVRRSDLAEIVKLKPAKARRAAGSVVTVAEFNALVDDVLAIRNALDVVAGKVKP